MTLFYLFSCPLIRTIVWANSLVVMETYDNLPYVPVRYDGILLQNNKITVVTIVMMLRNKINVFVS